MARTEVRRLSPVTGFPFPVRASAGAESRAEELAARTERVLAWMTDALHITPTLTLNVADQDDWASVTDMPLYGMPRTTDGEITVGIAEAPFYAEQLASYEPHISEATRANLREEFGEAGELLPYYEAIHVHEVTHAYQQQEWNSYPDLWLAELHANIGMIGYLNEMEPDMLAPVRALTSVVYDMPADTLWFRELPDMPQALENGLFNYAWYFFHLTLAAEDLWETGGTPLFRRLFDYVRARQHAAEPGPVTRDEMWAVHPALAQMMDEWPSGGGSDRGADWSSDQAVDQAVDRRAGSAGGADSANRVNGGGAAEPNPAASRTSDADAVPTTPDLHTHNPHPLEPTD